MEITTTASAPTRRRDRLGIHSLDHFCFSVPDLAVAKQFYTAFGLDVRDAGDALRLYTFGHPHCWAIVRGGTARKQIEYLSFGVYGDEIDAFRARLRDENVELLRSGEHVTDEGLWFHDCDGRLVQIKAAAKSSPDGKSVVSNPSAAAGARGTGPRAEQPSVRPSRLAHILLFTTDLQRAMRFYSSTLGLRLSDEAEVVAFMHGAHGSDHHLIAFGQANGTGLHHSSWDVCSIQEVGLGAMQMAAAGYARGWGVGRHVLGSNYFYYVRDPWDSYAEYSCDIDYVPADIDWPSQSFTADNGFYLWAPPPPEDFAHDYE
ncbi:VOC family protein [Paraburkholderia elongata]|uniref:VOC family protein n=1 Tax=Paraburkholderia elongata TaxID=2675747 RepID=UPI002E2D8B92|nr:VOC family protein [Paraburkholderia elongata]